MRRLAMWILNRRPIFEIPQVSDDGQVDVYLRRWFLKGRSKSTGYRVMVHEILLSDQGRDLHDHPWDFISIGLHGSYRESYHDGTSRVFKAPWIRLVRAEQLHRLDLVTDKAWTLILNGRKRRHWGFLTSEGWVHWDEYHATAEHVPGVAA